jgi:hypothetical protein
MAQFRLGSHWLGIQQGRIAGIPRPQRCCAHCPGQLEDELHLLECPMYAELRGRYGICTRHADMRGWEINKQFNKQDACDWNKLAEFLVQWKRLKVRLFSSSVPLGYHPAASHEDLSIQLAVAGVTVAR